MKAQIDRKYYDYLLNIERIVKAMIITNNNIDIVGQYYIDRIEPYINELDELTTKYYNKNERII